MCVGVVFVGGVCQVVWVFLCGVFCLVLFPWCIVLLVCDFCTAMRLIFTFYVQ